MLPKCALAPLLALATALAVAAAASAADPVHPPSTVVRAIDLHLGSIDARAPGSDNWAITWADDGAQYTTWGDGGGFGGTNGTGRVSFGVARVDGGRRSYEGVNVWGGADAENEARFDGKSYGLLDVSGVLWMWRTGDASSESAFDVQDLYVSRDGGASWDATEVVFDPGDFPRSEGFFAPTFLQFGQGYAGARDGFVYVYAPEVKSSSDWNVQVPGEIALLRAPSDSLDDRDAYELFAGLEGGRPTWTSVLAEREPVFRDAVNGVMRTSVTYNAGLGRYLLVTQQGSRFKSEGARIGLYDAPEPWGPWTTVLFADPWELGLQDSGGKTVFWNFSNKWTSADGRRFVLVYTGPGEDSWATVEGVFRLPEPGAAASAGAALLALALLVRAGRGRP